MDLDSTTKPTAEFIPRDKTQAFEFDALNMLTAQHREVDALFTELELAGERAFRTKEKLLGAIIEKLQLHTSLEEEVFYPAVKRVDSSIILEFYEEHDNIEKMFDKLSSITAEDASFDAKVKVLKNLIHHHVDQEEHRLFRECREEFEPSLLSYLGQKMQALITRGQRGRRHQGDEQSAARNQAHHH